MEYLEKVRNCVIRSTKLGLRRIASLNGAGPLNPMWNEPSIVLPAMRVMIDDSCANMASLCGINYELAAPIAEMTTAVNVSKKMR